MLAKAGVSLVTIHGRTREQRSRERADWESIRRVVEDLAHLDGFGGGRLRVLANGSVRSVEDAIECTRLTGVDGVMVAEGLLRNPWRYDVVVEEEVVVVVGTTEVGGGLVSCVDRAREYLECARRHPPPELSRGRCLRDHLSWMLKEDLSLLVVEEEEEKRSESGSGGRSRALLGMLENDKMETMWQMERFLDHVERFLGGDVEERRRVGEERSDVCMVLSLKEILNGEMEME